MFKMPLLKSLGLFSLFIVLYSGFSISRAAPYETNMMPPFTVRAAEGAPRTVYIQVRNTSGAPFLHVTEAIAAAFQANNYTISKNPNEAYYIIHATLPQAGEITQLQNEMLLSLGYGKTETAAKAAVETSEEEFVITDTTTTDTFSETDATTNTGESNIENTPPDTQKNKPAIDKSPLLYGITMDMQIAIRQPQGKRVRYQVRISTSTPKTNASFESVAPALTKHLAEGVMGIFRE